jgi:hypothetical protein
MAAMTTIEVPAPFDPADSVVIREPERFEPGYWVGCPSVLVVEALRST